MLTLEEYVIKFPTSTAIEYLEYKKRTKKEELEKEEEKKRKMTEVYRSYIGKPVKISIDNRMIIYTIITESIFTSGIHLSYIVEFDRSGYNIKYSATVRDKSINIYWLPNQYYKCEFKAANCEEITMSEFKTASAKIEECWKNTKSLFDKLMF